MSLLSGEVVVSAGLELGLVDLPGVDLGSKLVVLVLELGVLDLHRVELGLNVVHGVVGGLELAEDVGVVALEVEHDLVELGGLVLELLGGLEQGLSEFLSGVASVLVLVSEVVDLSLPGLLVSEL